MSEPVQLEEKKSGKSKTSKISKKSNNKSQNNEATEKISSPNNEETKQTENNEKNENAPQQVLSTRAYLEQNVTPVVQEALLECARKRPDNPLEFVGNYILNRAKGK